jgi:AMP-binding enzyme/alcohol dehydrogenase-like protein
MLGYFDDQAATESSFNAAGWFLTGDLGCMDEAGYLRITGRKKDVIIRGGHNIFPAKIENYALRHDGVAKAAVVPVPDKRLGERVCLVVQARPGLDLDAQELLAHLDARAPRRRRAVEVRHARVLRAGRGPAADAVGQDPQASAGRVDRRGPARPLTGPLHPGPCAPLTNPRRTTHACSDDPPVRRPRRRRPRRTTGPVPGEHEVLVEVRAAPVNYVDLVTMRGEYQFVPELPYVPGKGAAGVIRSVGARPARERA